MTFYQILGRASIGGGRELFCELAATHFLISDLALTNMARRDRAPVCEAATPSLGRPISKNFNFFEMFGFKIFRKGKANQINLDTNMNIVADDRISETRGFTNQFTLFPTAFGGENGGQKPGSRLSREPINAFLNAERDNARSAHFFTPPAEPPTPVPEKHMAAGVLKQAAYDLRRFRGATTGVKRELYLDAYSWITAHDFSWPYSFVNVCKLLDVCPEVIRAELLADASLSWLDYWTKRAGRVSRRLQSSFGRVFASCRNPEGAEVGQLTSSI